MSKKIETETQEDSFKIFLETYEETHKKISTVKSTSDPSLQELLNTINEKNDFFLDLLKEELEHPNPKIFQKVLNSFTQILKEKKFHSSNKIQFLQKIIEIRENFKDIIPLTWIII